MNASGYPFAFGVALIVVGAVLVCVALILRHRAQIDPAEPSDGSELRALVDSLHRTDETEENVRPRTVRDLVPVSKDAQQCNEGHCRGRDDVTF
jgi:hypothetical protein